MVRCGNPSIRPDLRAVEAVCTVQRQREGPGGARAAMSMGSALPHRLHPNWRDGSPWFVGLGELSHHVNARRPELHYPMTERGQPATSLREMADQGNSELDAACKSPTFGSTMARSIGSRAGGRNGRISSQTTLRTSCRTVCTGRGSGCDAGRRLRRWSAACRGGLTATTPMDSELHTVRLAARTEWHHHGQRPQHRYRCRSHRGARGFSMAYRG